MSDRPTAAEARCPECRKAATSNPVIGWLFHCKPCDYGWGHPQFHTHQWAMDCLRLARAEDSAGRLPDARGIDSGEAGETRSGSTPRAEGNHEGE